MERVNNCNYFAVFLVPLFCTYKQLLLFMNLNEELELLYECHNNTPCQQAGSKVLQLEHR